jgi:hypothetical protein
MVKIFVFFYTKMTERRRTVCWKDGSCWQLCGGVHFCFCNCGQGRKNFAGGFWNVGRVEDTFIIYLFPTATTRKKRETVR